MITDRDLKEIQARGIAETTLNRQLELLEKGITFQEIDRAATIGDGIIVFSETEKNEFQALWKAWNNEHANQVQSLIPASGAATRMFKKLYQFIEGQVDEKDAEIEFFFHHITAFSFYRKLNEVCLEQMHQSVPELIKQGKGQEVCKRLLFEEGLSYGLLPKGLLHFHIGLDREIRTPLAEHIIEACQFRGGNHHTIKIHFSVSLAAKYLFEKEVEEIRKHDSLLVGQSFNVEFSVQKISTDTVAVNHQGELLRDAEGSIQFRPGGHGALIENLNDLKGDILFIRNIDNISPIQKMKNSMQERGVLAGFLLSVREKIFHLLTCLHSNNPFSELDVACCQGLLDQWKINKRVEDFSKEELIALLNRPIRVCGMVKNVGEAGGGPFWVKHKNGIKLHILEKAQINTLDKNQKEKFEKSTHFNPVDIVCSLSNFQGIPFDLTQFIDHDQVFIVEKTINGIPIKAIELPGLWNGAMAEWITFFVDLPLSIFTPVKTINDLLRPDHQ